MKTVFRTDRAPIQKHKKTSQGFLKVPGRFARAGIYEYRNDDGGLRRELRPKEEVHHADSLASFDSAPVTMGHPAEGEVTSANVKRYEVGNVAGEGRADGDFVAGDVVVKHDSAIKAVEGGLQELSPGYRINLDEKPGTDRRYAYPGNPEGRYDAIQRNIRVNHLAIVPKARGGSGVRLRMDSAEGVRRDSDGMMTTAVSGHQHLVEMCGWDGQRRTSGETSYQLSAGSDSSHCHPWTRGIDGKITIGEADGHSHGLLDDAALLSAAQPYGLASRGDNQFDQLLPRTQDNRMDKDEQIRSLREQLAAAEGKLAPLSEQATRSVARADAAEATTHTLRGEIGELRAQIASAATVLETEAIQREKNRADAAETKLQARLDGMDELVAARVMLERKAAVVLPDVKLANMPARQIHATVVKRLDAQADIGSGVSDAYLEGRFDSLLELHSRNARSLQTISDVVNSSHRAREDADTKSTEQSRAAYRNRGNEPLPNSREAAAARRA